MSSVPMKSPSSPSATASTWQPFRRQAGPTFSTAADHRRFSKSWTRRRWPSPTIAEIANTSAAKARLKIYAHVEVVSLAADPALTERIAAPGYKAKPERILLLHLAAFDWNCPQHITRRFTEGEMAQVLDPLREQLAALELENAALRAKLAWRGSMP